MPLKIMCSIGVSLAPPSVEREAALAACRDAYYGHGKLEILSKLNVGSLDEIATLYTPGVAYSVQEIITRPEALHELSAKDNTIAVVTDGTAVLGLGRAEPRAAVPVMRTALKTDHSSRGWVGWRRTMSGELLIPVI